MRRRPLRLIASLSLFICSLFLFSKPFPAQAGTHLSPRSAQATTHSADISGVVYSYVQGSSVGLAGATINVEGCTGGPVTSGADGSFTITVGWTVDSDTYACTIWGSMAGHSDSRRYLIDVPVNPGYTLSLHVEENQDPVITFLGVSGPPISAYGWYNDQITLSWSCTDSGSGVVDSIVDDELNHNQANQYGGASCEDWAGNTAGNTQGPYNIDEMDPHVYHVESLTEPNSQDWFGANFYLEWRCSDELSGPVESSMQRLITLEGLGQSVTVACEDLAGNIDEYTYYYNLDKTPPTGVTVVPSGTLGNNGWYVSDVTLTTVSDPDISNPIDCTAPQVMSSDSMGQVFSGTCTNAAGHSSSGSVEVKRDTFPPHILFPDFSGPVGLNDWYIGSVMVRWTCMDQMSRPVSTNMSTIASEEGATVHVTATCTDRAGNVETDQLSGFGIDLTPPSVTLVPTGSLGTNGWFTGDLTIQTTGTDIASGVESCSADQMLTTDTAGQTFTGSCSDFAGRSSSNNLTVKRDATPPVIKLVSRDPAPDWQGNNHGPITFIWSCQDALSGALQDTVTIIYSNPGMGQTVTGTCMDAAGNRSTNSQRNVNIVISSPIDNELPLKTVTQTITATATLTHTPTATPTQNEQPKSTATNTSTVVPPSSGAIDISEDKGMALQPGGIDETSPKGNFSGWVYAGIGLAFIILLAVFFFVLKKRKREQR